MKSARAAIVLCLIISFFPNDSIGMASDRVVINPVYRNFLFPSMEPSNRVLHGDLLPLECASEDEVTAVLTDCYTRRLNTFKIHFVSTFLFDEFSDLLDTIHDSILAQDDYLSLSFQRYQVSYSGRDGDVTIDFTVDYLTTFAQEQAVDERVTEILAQEMIPGMDDANKVKAIHDWIILNLEYDFSYSRYSAYDALFHGSVVCQGYSLLAYKLFEKAGMSARIVVSNGMDHAWNMVLLCGSWYHIDCTWDDPVPDEPGRILYTYYLMSDDEFIYHDTEIHTWPASIYPSAIHSYTGEICFSGDNEPALCLTRTQVSQLYVSIFGRASEGDGNAYWMATQQEMVIAADTMLETAPAREYFGATLEANQLFIEFIYENTLGKTYAQDPDGVDYWVGELAKGKSKGQVVAALIEAVMDPKYAGLAAQDQFINRVAVSNYAAETIIGAIDITDVPLFVQCIEQVTHELSTLVNAKGKVDEIKLLALTL